MDLTRPVLWAVGIFAAIVIGVVAMIRNRSVNAQDPLQERLAEHLRAYLGSGGSADDKTAVTEALRRELRQRQVPRDEWRFRLSAAVSLIGATASHDGSQAMKRAEDLVQIIERLGTSS